MLARGRAVAAGGVGQAGGVQGFGESGDAKGLSAKHGLDPAGIAGSVRKFLNR